MPYERKNSREPELSQSYCLMHLQDTLGVLELYFMRVFSWLVHLQEHAQRTPVSPLIPLPLKKEGNKNRERRTLEAFYF